VNDMPAPATRDYFAELYVAALFGDDGWSVYFPKRDVGFDFIATKQVGDEVLIRPVQVKGLYPTEGKTDKSTYGFDGQLTAVHSHMVLAIPFFSYANQQAPEQVAFIPLSRCKKTSDGGRQCSPCKFEDGKAVPRRDFKTFFGKDGLASVGNPGWGESTAQGKP
jgi:hypothetical protein